MCKAYVRVSWSFLKAVLLSMNFSYTWINWVMECVTTVQFTLLLDGNPTQPFYPSRGLRQGDPISPYLFLLCANILSIALTKVKSQKKLSGIKIGRNGASFTHLFFANDSLFFFQNDKCSLTNLENTIHWYCSLFGQAINFSKSNLYCSPNIPLNIQENLASSLQVNLVQCPRKYLGLSFKLRGRRVIDFQDLIDKVQAKLQGCFLRLEG